MTSSSQGQTLEDNRVGRRYFNRYSADPLKFRLLIRLFGTMSPCEDADNLARRLRVPEGRVRKSLRTLVLDGLVSERKESGVYTYSLSRSPAARSLVAHLLREAIQTGVVTAPRGPEGTS